MNAPASLLRPLQALAVVLAVAIAVLLALWVRMEPAPALARAPEQGADGTGATDTSTANATTEPRTEPAPQAATANSAPPPSDQGESAVLFGTIRSPDGAPIASGNLWLAAGVKSVGSAQLRDGCFVFAGLQAGTYRLSSRIEDQLPLHREVEVRAPTTRIDIELADRWLLTVNAVTPDGAPWLEAVRKAAPRSMLRGTSALAFVEPLTGDLPASNHAEVRGGVGIFRDGSDPFRTSKAMKKQTLGVMTLPPGQAVHVAILLRHALVAQQAVSPDQEEITFTLPVDAIVGRLAKVRLRLVDPSGAPVGKARVSLNDAQTGGGGLPSGDDGRVVLEHLVPGRLDLEIWAKDLSAPHVEILVPPSADLDLGDIALQPPTTVELQFENFGGKGSVRCNLLDSIRPDWVAKDLYFSAENGKVQEYPLFPGRYGMLASGPNGVAVAVVDLRSPPTGPVRFDLRRGADLRIEYALGAAKATYEVTSLDGMLIRRREVSGAAGESVELPTGSYTVRVTDQNGTTTRRDFTLPAAGLTLKVP